MGATGLMRAKEVAERLEEFGFKEVTRNSSPFVAARIRQAELAALTVLLIHRFRPHECPWLARVGRDVLVVIAREVWKHNLALLEPDRAPKPALRRQFRQGALASLTVLLIHRFRRVECPSVAAVGLGALVFIAREVWAHDRACLEQKLRPQLQSGIAEAGALNEAVWQTFYSTTQWLHARHGKDEALIGSYGMLCEARGERRPLLYRYYVPYVMPRFLPTTWDSFWQLCELLRDNIRFLRATVEWPQENMASLDEMEKEVEAAEKGVVLSKGEHNGSR